jgi:hypothetical protein
VLLVAFWLAMRRRASAPALLVTVTMLAFQEDLIVFSRVAVPEMTVMAAQLLIYLAITSRRRRPWTLVLAGAASLFTVGIKMAALPVVGIFVLLVLIQPRDPSWDRSRWRDLTLFLTGLLSPLIVLAALSAALGPGVVLPRTVALMNGLVSLSSLYAALGFVFENSMAPALNLWLLALWCALVGWRAAGPVTDAASRRLLVTSVTWVAAYGVVMLGLGYFPNRYKIHIVVPMAVAIAVGLTLLERAGRARIDALFESGGGARALLIYGFLGLPTAVVIAPLLGAAVGLLGGEPERLRVKIVCTLLAIVVTALALVIVGRRRQLSSVFFLVFPVTSALIWSTAQRTGLYDAPFWATTSFGPHMARWLSILLVAGGVAGVATVAGRDAPGATFVLAARTSALWYLVLCLPALVPAYLTPHYSIPNVSRQLATLLADAPEPIGSSGVDGLFREGRLHYLTVHRKWPSARPRVMAIMFNFRDPYRILEREYCLTDVLPVYVSPMYFRAHAAEAPTSALGESVRIYRRRGANGCPR